MGRICPTSSRPSQHGMIRVTGLVVVLSSCCMGVPVPQGLLNGISNLLTGVIGGGGNAGEVDSYQNAPYSVVQKFDGYEERFYPSAAWVCTRTGGFQSLFRYISGANNRGKEDDIQGNILIFCFQIRRLT